MPLCNYGCGREGKFYFKSVKKWCCKSHYMKCPNTQKEPWNKGKTGVYSKETIEKIKEKRKQQVIIHSQATKEKIGKANKGKKRTQETKDKLREINLGNKASQKTRSKLSKIRTGRKLSNETKKKIGDAHRGKIVSDETRKKLSIAGKGHTRNKGTKRSREAKRNMRIAAIKRLKKRQGQLIPNYNISACNLIDEYGKQNGYNFQHAENGGEFYIKELGYWVDGYDEEKNTVIEVDESHHFDADGNLSEKDIIRQKEITEYLGCDFIRLKI